MTISVFQLGARMKYTVPQYLHQAKILEKVYTDICVDLPPFNWSSKLIQKLPWNAIQKFIGRKVDLPQQKITHFPILGLRYFMRKRGVLNEESECVNFIWADKNFGNAVNEKLQNELSEMLYLYNTAALTIAKDNKHRKIILEQCSLPYSTYRDRIRKEMTVYSDWTRSYASDDNLPDAVHQYIQNEELEWALSDHIICPSKNVEESLIHRGVPGNKISCIPYGFTFSGQHQPRTISTASKLKVGTIGYLTLRKGIHYFYKVASICNFAEFVAIGGDGFDLPEEKKVLLSKVIKLTGHLDRKRLLENFSKIDVLLFLTVGEGSATVVYEALSLGIPVITTAASGSIVEDGVNGFIVDPADIQRIMFLLEQMCNPEFYHFLSENALKRSIYGSSEAYGSRLVNFVQAFLQPEIKPIHLNIQ